MNLSTTYMGFTLPHPIVPGASPLVDRLDMVRRLEDAGAPLLVMHSLFEEQIVREEMALSHAIEAGRHAFAEALSYFPVQQAFALGPHEYLEQIRRIKAAVSVPVIASLNGTTSGGWLEYGRQIEQAGADGLELNLYQVATDMDESGAETEDRELDVVMRLKHSLRIPLAVKLSPFYSSIPHFARKLDELGADSLVLFNRFYEPDIDVEQLEATRALHLSTSAELPLRLRWLGVLSGQVTASLAVTGGVHTAIDVVKAVMAGAHVTQMVSALLQSGPEHLTTVRDGLERWLEEHEYESLEQMRGSMSLLRCGNSPAYARANYATILHSWEPRRPTTDG